MQKATRHQLKQQNRDLVFKILSGSSQISRAEIARITGLTRTTVSTIMADLITDGLVREVGMGISLGGKSPIMLSMVDDARYVIGLDLAYKQFQGAIVDLRGQIRQMISLPVEDYKGEKAIEATLSILDQLIGLPYNSIIGIGVGAPGLINSVEGVVVNAVNLEWGNLHLRQLLQQRYGLPVVVCNDCQAAAMGEYIYGGNPPASRNMIVVRVGNGIGAGVIIDGKIFQGDGGGAGEIGHLVMMQNGGTPCRCGKFGCLETLASARAVVQRTELLLGTGIKTVLTTNGTPITLEKVDEAFQLGDPLAQQIIYQAGYYLGVALSSLVSTLNIHEIILMGEMTRFGQPWLDVVQKTMEQNALTRLGMDTRVKIGTLRDHDVILGASAMLAGNYALLFNH